MAGKELTSEQLEKRRRANTVILTVTGIVLALCLCVIGFGILTDDEGQEESQESTTSQSSKSTSASSSSAPSSTSTTKESSTASRRAAVAERVRKDLDPFFPDCHWQEPSAPGEGIVDTWTCEEHELLLSTDDSHSGVKVYVDGMKDEINQGYGLLGEDYALLVTNQADLNHSWDVLGADAERVDFSN